MPGIALLLGYMHCRARLHRILKCLGMLSMEVCILSCTCRVAGSGSAPIPVGLGRLWGLCSSNKKQMHVYCIKCNVERHWMSLVLLQWFFLSHVGPCSDTQWVTRARTWDRVTILCMSAPIVWRGAYSQESVYRIAAPTPLTLLSSIRAELLRREL